MLQINPEFFVEPTAPKTKSPHRESGGAILKPSQGEFCRLHPATIRGVQLRAESPERSTPMWQAALRD